MNFTTKTLKPFVGAAMLAAIATAVAQPAHAISISVSPGTQYTTTVSGATTLDFNGQGNSSPINYTNGFATYSGNGRFVSGSVPGQYAQPPNNDPAYLTLGASQEPGPVTINFAQALNYFGLYWGSVDTYNDIDFYSGSTLLRSVLGSEVIAAAAGVQDVSGARFVDFFAEGTESFDKIVLRSSQAAFESDNHAYRVVPTPALIPAALGFTAALLRKRKGEQDEAAGAEA